MVGLSWPNHGHISKARAPIKKGRGSIRGFSGCHRESPNTSNMKINLGFFPSAGQRWSAPAADPMGIWDERAVPTKRCGRSKK